MVMGVCAASEVNNWTVFDSLDLTSQQQQEQEKGLLGRTDSGPTKTVFPAHPENLVLSFKISKQSQNRGKTQNTNLHCIFNIKEMQVSNQM